MLALDLIIEQLTIEFLAIFMTVSGKINGFILAGNE